MALAGRKRRTVGVLPSIEEVVLHEGWCVKESGGAFLGRTNWRRRWFRLVQRKDETILQYLRGRSDTQPAGSVKLDITYCTRQVESKEKGRQHVFAVGPLLDDGSTRTYYISCSSQQSMEEWMTVVDAAIQGVPEQAHRRRQTISRKYGSSRNTRFCVGHGGPGSRPLSSDSSHRDMEESIVSSRGAEALSLSSTYPPPDKDIATVDQSEIHQEDLSDEELLESLEDDGESGDDEEDVGGGEGEKMGARERVRARQEAATPDSHLSPDARLRLYENQNWRMEHWSELCRIAKTAKWKKVDTHDGITLARCKFGRGSGGHAIIKIEGTLAADPSTVYQFLQLSTREGGKLDYIFRNELLLDIIEEDPKASLISNQFHPPLPRISKRDLVAMKMWVPEFITRNNMSGFVMFSVDHPNAPEPQKDSRRMHINPSGIILSPSPGPDGAIHSKAVILLQVAFFGALHRMLKGAYNSGLLKLGLRTTFTHISEQLQRFVELVNM